MEQMLRAAGWTPAEIAKYVEDIGNAGAVTEGDWYVAELVVPMLDAMTTVTETLSGEKYATLCLVLPGVVTLLNAIDSETQSVQAARGRLRQGRHATETDKQRAKACDSVLDWLRLLRESLTRRLDPYDFGESNRPYLVATFVHPGGKRFLFYPDDDGGNGDSTRSRALRAAMQFAVEDMDAIHQVCRFVPDWARSQVQPPAAAAPAAPAAAAAGAALDDQPPPAKRVKLSFESINGAPAVAAVPRPGGAAAPAVAGDAAVTLQDAFKAVVRKYSEMTVFAGLHDLKDYDDVDKVLGAYKALPSWTATPLVSLASSCAWRCDTCTLLPQRRVWSECGVLARTPWKRNGST